MPTIRAQFHRLREGASTPVRQEVGSNVYQVFDGTGRVLLGDTEHTVEHGDIFVVPSWCRFRLQAETRLDLFHFSDTPIFEGLGLYREFEEETDR